MPPSDRTQAEKTDAYEKLGKYTRQFKNKGPMYTMGDFNARLIYPTTDDEEVIMGKHTLHNNAAILEDHTDDMRDNRNLLVEYCITNEIRVTNTMYRKQPNKTATKEKTKKQRNTQVNLQTRKQTKDKETTKQTREQTTQQ